MNYIRRYSDIIVVGGKSHTRACQLGGSDKKFVWSLVPDTHREGRTRKHNVHSCLDTHKGKVVCGVLTLGGLTARDKVLEHGVARKALGRCRVTALGELYCLWGAAVCRYGS